MISRYRNGSNLFLSKAIGRATNRPTALLCAAQSTISLYRSKRSILVSHMLSLGVSIFTTLETSHRPRQPQIDSGIFFRSSLLRHSALSHSTGTSGLPRAVCPQQQPKHTETLPTTKRFVVKESQLSDTTSNSLMRIDYHIMYTMPGMLFSPRETSWLTYFGIKTKLLNRVRRIRGQVESIETAIEEGADCSDILHTISACRGAINSLMAEVIDGHIRFHVIDPDHEPTSEKAKTTQELIDVIRTYLR
jgi:FrmR/RcnR family transcriptional regulator, repressor of frmRAB operon